MILNMYLLVLSVFFIFRLILFFTELDRIESLRAESGTILQAFLMGVRFDVVIAGYILLLPFVILSVQHIAGIQRKWVSRFLFYWVFLLFAIAFLICAADIPYFNAFFARFSAGAFQWIESPVFVLKMIFEEPRYFIILIPFFLLLYFFFKRLQLLFRVQANPSFKPHYGVHIVVSILCAGLIFLGIRGRLESKSPIRVGTAYFSDNPFLNQLGLNPVFTFMRSCFDLMDEDNSTVAFMSNRKAIQNVRAYLGIRKPMGDFPIARKVMADSSGEKKYNVILVIMESMSAAKMTRYGCTQNLTPFLDSISHKGYSFDNIYTAGIHTFNGIFSTLFSLPALYRQNPMKESTIFRYNGIGYTLRKKGYSTTYFTTHDGQFDNVEGFLRANDFEQVITVADYPSEKVKGPLGVPDDYMFEFAMPVLDRLQRNNKPFFATFMTASDHGPFYIPDYFEPRNTETREQVVEYADWSLRKLVTLASSKPWFKNTVFVFVADHGSPMNAVYDIPLDYHHTPLIFYAPDIIKDHKSFTTMGGQIDVFPTIMGILNQSYINNTLGINLLRESRPYIFINHDDMSGVLSRDYFLIIKENGENVLYRYVLKDKTDYNREQPKLAADMKEYAFSNLQVFQYLMQTKARFIDK